MDLVCNGNYRSTAPLEEKEQFERGCTLQWFKIARFLLRHLTAVRNDRVSNLVDCNHAEIKQSVRVDEHLKMTLASKSTRDVV
ncbi:hypothetical protein TNCV_3926831 [Trichonephila clavipes]|nr:hypothetical protein TNCV_3926831 [Trichonephila clavipes]